MSVIKPSYRANNQTITITLASLGNGSARQSTVVDNSSNHDIEVYIFVKWKNGGSGISPSGYVNIYALGSADAGTTYTENAGATDAAITLTSPPNARLIGTVNAVTASTTYYGGPFPLSVAFGGTIPDHWGIVIENK